MLQCGRIPHRSSRRSHVRCCRRRCPAAVPPWAGHSDLAGGPRRSGLFRPRGCSVPHVLHLQRRPIRGQARHAAGAHRFWHRGAVYRSDSALAGDSRAPDAAAPAAWPGLYRGRDRRSGSRLCDCTVTERRLDLRCGPDGAGDGVAHDHLPGVPGDQAQPHGTAQGMDDPQLRRDVCVRVLPDRVHCSGGPQAGRRARSRADDGVGMLGASTADDRADPARPKDPQGEGR